MRSNCRGEKVHSSGKNRNITQNRLQNKHDISVHHLQFAILREGRQVARMANQPTSRKQNTKFTCDVSTFLLTHTGVFGHRISRFP